MTEQRIHLLDETTINQIAAGEVIENPASVVKELVENALDSGAHSISVETNGGGRGLICISDDGCGMNSDDLILALERHATSKLTELDDLNSLITLGFRGEALPSIASVSKLLIHTADAGEGRVLHAEGGRILRVQPKPRRQGTTVEVKSLFFNVPVRKKFQKSVGWDRAEIHKVLTKMALCYQAVAFSWISDGEEQFVLPADANLSERIHVLLGESFSQSMLPVEHREERLHLSGFSSRASYHRPNRTGQYLFINGRPVISPFVSRKILEGYGTRLSTHRYPLFVLHLTLPPSLIDVNVHPQKKEIRLCDERRLESFLLEAVEKCFIPKKQATVSTPTFSVSEPVSTYSAPLIIEIDEEESLEELPDLFSQERHILAKVGNYLFLEDAKGIRVVDGGAARLRVAYEQLLQRDEKKAIQHLLIPIQIEVTSAEKTLWIENQLVFEEVGFSIRHFGGNTFIVDAIPAYFESEEIPAFVHAFLEEGDIPREKKIASALRKTLKLRTRAGGEALIETLFKCKEPDLTPDGKPTHYLLTEKGLAKLFR